MRTFVVRHAWRINFYISAVGMMGVGYLLFRLLDRYADGSGSLVALSVMFLMACAKIMIHVIVNR